MRGTPVWPLVLTLVGGCFTQSTSEPPPYEPPNGWSGGGNDGGGGGGGGGGYYGCRQDTDCSTCFVCARDGECIAAADAHAIRISWTMKSAEPDATTCTAQPTLALTFTESASGDWTGFAPVPCSEGKFSIDKFPKRFDQVMLSPAWGVDGPTTEFGSDGTATLDLPY